MKFRQATRDDHPLMQEMVEGLKDVHSVTEAWVTDNEEGGRFWVVACPYAFGQIRLQLWHERRRLEPYPTIFSEM